MGIAGFGFAWDVYCLIVAIKRVEQTEGVRIAESVKTLKELTKGEENDENTIKKLIERLLFIYQISY